MQPYCRPNYGFKFKDTISRKSAKVKAKSVTLLKTIPTIQFDFAISQPQKLNEV